MGDPRLSPDQTTIVEAAIAGGLFRSSTEPERKKCRSLNSKGLLWRDRSDGDVWQATDAAKARFGGGAVAVVPADASGLVETVERARALLDAGDVAKARILAAGAYAQAKAEGQFAVRFDAAEHLVARARQLQADALMIEARAKMIISADWDAAQDEGATASSAKGGRPKTVTDGNSLSAADTGLSRKELHDARKLAAAEKDSPGIVERAIRARLAAGLEPTRASLRHAIGTRSATKEERGDNLYETPAEAMHTLLALETFTATVWEPACGRGAISRMLEDAGYGVVLSDLNDYSTADQNGELQSIIDFRDTKPGVGDCFDIVTNPPYGEALNSFIAHALRVHKPRKMALLLNSNAYFGFEDLDRVFIMETCPPARIYAFSRRLPMMHRDGWDGPKASSQMNTEWFVWERQNDGTYGDTTVRRRVNWADFMPGRDAESEAA